MLKGEGDRSGPGDGRCRVVVRSVGLEEGLGRDLDGRDVVCDLVGGGRWG